VKELLTNHKVEKRCPFIFKLSIKLIVADSIIHLINPLLTSTRCCSNGLQLLLFNLCLK